MIRIFISYSRETETFARKLGAALSDGNYDVWLDVEDIPGGMKWSSAIQEGLDTAQVMLVIISPGAMASLNVEDEWQYFMDKGKPVIPLWYQPAEVHFQLNRLQYIDFHSQPFDKALARLLQEIQRKLTDPGKAFVTPSGRTPYPDPVDARGYQQARWVRRLSYVWYAVIVAFIGFAVLSSGLLESAAPSTGSVSGTRASISVPGLTEIPVHARIPLAADAVSDGVVEDPVFIWRHTAGDEMVYLIENPNAPSPLYVDEASLSSEIRSGVLTALPLYESNLFSGTAIIFDAPDPEAASITYMGSGTNSAFVHGYTHDMFGDAWFYIYAQRRFGWVPVTGEHEALLAHLPVVVTVSEAVAFYDADPDEALGATSTLRIVGQTDSAYQVVLQHDSVWGVYRVDKVNVSLPPLLAERIPARA